MSINKGICIDCKHYNSGKINFYEPDTPRSCSNGNTDNMNKFWSDCGKLTREQSKDYNVPCFEPTETAVKLQELIDIADGVLSDLKKIYKEG